MKKTVLILITTLIAIFALLSVFSMNTDYEAEKLFFSAMKANSKITMNPEVAPPALLASVENKMKKVIQKYPKSSVAKQANMNLAEFYIIHKRFQDAQSHIDALIDKYPDDKRFTSNAIFLKGIAYERAGKWPEALKVFGSIKSKYESTPIGFQVPLYIARHYEESGDTSAAAQAYLEAIDFYKQVESKNSGKPLGYLSSAAMIQIYFQLKNYPESAQVFADTMSKYKNSMYQMQLIQYVDSIYVNKMKNPSKAIEIYLKLQKGIPNAKIKRLLTKKIAQLKKLSK